MTQLNTPFHLHAAGLAADWSPSEAGDLPAEVAGQACTYFWKEMIHAGNYAQPARGISLAVDRARLARWADVGARMLAAGVAVPINCDHSTRARDVVGYVKEFKLEDDRLMALCQLIGQDAALTAARNLVSVGIDPDFTDGELRNWGESIVHLALTPVPMVTNQGEFVAASMGDEETEKLMLVEQGDQTGTDEETGTQLVVAEQVAHEEAAEGEVSGEIALESGTSEVEEPALSEVEGPAASEIEGLRIELSRQQTRILELSAQIPTPMSDETAGALAALATARFEEAVNRGVLSPAARDRLLAALVRSPEGRANLVALSRNGSAGGGERGLALTVADILLDNQSIDVGEKTGLQAMTRSVPGDESMPLNELREYMRKVASVSG